MKRPLTIYVILITYIVKGRFVYSTQQVGYKVFKVCSGDSYLSTAHSDFLYMKLHRFLEY
ncbi:hypothetical protein BFGS084_03702 [Bacteroides fragilis]|nr:hypothetical protein BFGS084_03702 [Bacteroides fragilis]